jgi:hypothetical protein
LIRKTLTKCFWKDFGCKTGRIILGHKSVVITEVYAENHNPTGGMARNIAWQYFKLASLREDEAEPANKVMEQIEI